MKITITKTALEIDATKAIHAAIARATNGSKIVIPDGAWPCSGPVKVLDKNITIDCEGTVTLYPAKTYVDDGSPFFTFGATNPREKFLQRQQINGLVLCSGGDNATAPKVGLRLLNVNFSIIDKIRVEYFDTAYQQWTSEGMFSYGNELRSCYAMQAKIAFQQTGVPDPKWGLQATGTRLTNFSNESQDRLECLFELEGQSNRATNVWSQGGNNPVLIKSTGGGNNVVEMAHFEAEVYPCGVLFKSNGNTLRTNGRNIGEWLHVYGYGYQGNSVT
jgi:hypothetical protein